jgi:hypothetical protein
MNLRIANLDLIWQRIIIMICLHILTIFQIDGRIISVSYRMNMALITSRIHTAEPLVPEPNSFKAEITIQKLKRYIYLLVPDQILN